eukprot:GHVP01058561.1.p2 GENE.GHVP01058561.1~~GHVP01058561.1.p2  ORF type:complete len:115 (-),score=11.61 GHVP01058561.1:820-1164(-)
MIGIGIATFLLIPVPHLVSVLYHSIFLSKSLIYTSIIKKQHFPRSDAARTFYITNVRRLPILNIFFTRIFFGALAVCPNSSLTPNETEDHFLFSKSGLSYYYMRMQGCDSRNFG